MPTKKLRANVKTIIDYIELIKNGVYLQDTFKKHPVIPNIIHAKVCNQCGELSHKEKTKDNTCSNKPRCLKCGSFSHKLNDCNSLTDNCINCKGHHRCNSDLCEKLIEKTFALNRYIIDLLEGEKIIKSKYDVLRTPRPDAFYNNKTKPEVINQENIALNNYIEELLDKKLNTKLTNFQKAVTTDIETHMQTKYGTLKLDIETIKTRVNKTDIKTLKENFDKFAQDLTDIKDGQASGFKAIANLITGKEPSD